ncbi:toxic anion resistance protein [Treponema saccharophilum]|uniref:Toxic anion resistance family protein n=2 Tax=Treponema saccharophilum TaxID=165 RepID=H7EKA3_9SPIR|nr:toxic anion resistance protein [Treponema saccharophilum]EIC01990.1 toxic anion resistance family protein [Treponema saccharophilum DSM 2985]BDC96509.1 toxic anion resistance protein [Treponema saccharophilum]
MALDFGRNEERLPVEDDSAVRTYDIVADRKSLGKTLVGSAEVDSLVSRIEVHNIDTIVNFGAEAAGEIAKASDAVLGGMSVAKIDETSELLGTLAKIMDKFDINEIKADPGFLSRMFGNLKKQIEKIMAKYHTLGEDVDKIYVQLKSFEAEIRESNKNLDKLFEANVESYHQLVKYILAGEQACAELDEYIAARRAELESTGDNSLKFEIQELEQARLMMEQRTQDLRMAENVAMQSIPMIKTMEFSNFNLIRKINSAFIVTLPVFKQGIAQAILLKRQRIQAESLEALDKRTNEMLVKNAQNTVEVSTATLRMVSESSIKIETLEKTWRTITSGIDEARRIGEDAKKKREEDIVRLDAIKREFMQKFNGKQ